MMDAQIQSCLAAARVPDLISSGDFGPWSISRQTPNRPADFDRIGREGALTVLSRFNLATLHRELGEVVMEDSNQELLRHAPAWKEACGNVLVTGLGLGCVVRGLLVCPAVTTVTVVERCEHIIGAVAPSFRDEHRLCIVHADALNWRPPSTKIFDIAWHDIWSDEDAGEDTLQLLHGKLMLRFRDIVVGRQGAWQFPREFKKIYRRAGFQYLRLA